MEGSNDMTEERPIERLSIINPGFSRDGVSALKPEGIPYLPVPSEAHAWPVVAVDPWETLQWWESPLQARVGIGMLTRRPFLSLHHIPDGRRMLIPTRVLYPYAIHTSQPDRIERAASTVAATVRQAREMYTAAQAAGVTDLGRPLLYFYGALGLAKAAIAAIFGAEALEEDHGLSRGRAPTVSSDQPPWPTLIEWHGRGQFSMLYRAARWDVDLYQCCYKDSRWGGRRNLDKPLRFHVLECIRALQYPWGTLPDTSLPVPGTSAFDAQMRSGLLLPHRDATDMFMRSATAHDAPLVQVPRVLVQYMLLYYFSILARYYPAEWQGLLAADREPEGYVFRTAMERVARDFVLEIVSLLPNVPPPWQYAPQEWDAQRPALDDWYTWPTVAVGAPSGVRFKVYSLAEWDGTPPDTCMKAQQIASSATGGTQVPSGA